MTSISLSQVPVTGSLPSKWPPNLQTFSAIVTSMTGDVPQSLIDSPKMTSLTIQNCAIGGTLPSVSEAFRTSSFLKSISVTSCKLTGLDENMFKWTKLESLDVSNNIINETLPSKVGTGAGANSNLKSLSIANNAFIGNLTSEFFSNAPLLNTLQASNCGLGGTLPTEIANKTNWKILSVSKNSFSGEIPDEGKWHLNADLKTIRFDNNQFDGIIPFGLFQAGGAKTDFLFEKNHLDICDLPENYSVPTSIATNCAVSLQTPAECGCTDLWPKKCTKGVAIEPCQRKCRCL